MAEIELSVLSRQCLDRRVPDFETLEAEAAAWQERRNTAGGSIGGLLPTMPVSSDSTLHFESNGALDRRGSEVRVNLPRSPSFIELVQILLKMPIDVVQRLPGPVR